MVKIRFQTHASLGQCFVTWTGLIIIWVYIGRSVVFCFCFVFWVLFFLFVWFFFSLGNHFTRPVMQYAKAIPCSLMHAKYHYSVSAPFELGGKANKPVAACLVLKLCFSFTYMLLCSGCLAGLWGCCAGSFLFLFF